ncbi:unnamed protein product [Arabidopsis thaliana]|uniref:(thale cress) hypothetical protein n=1 Tax=Arabidopsis thaliana TaxID=3702 RepID=A0A5S9XIG3_ARATH|nr:unnamed protein product [Arabidopsis thaliana]CAD5324506.1 unnamed protein product [Arabidopsis thaliana]
MWILWRRSELSRGKAEEVVILSPENGQKGGDWRRSPELHRRTTAATVSHQILATVTGAVVVHRRGS